MVDWQARIVARSEDRVAWLRARSAGVTATDAARLTSDTAVAAVAADKLDGGRFTGNAHTEHGVAREPVIGRWAAAQHGMRASTALVHAVGRPDHLATPDGYRERDGRLELCEIKTTSHPWRSVPRNYLRQIWWQQYVLGAERTLLVWEQHRDFVALGAPECRWIERDESEIHRLVVLADRVLELLRHG